MILTKETNQAIIMLLRDYKKRLTMRKNVAKKHKSPRLEGIQNDIELVDGLLTFFEEELRNEERK